MTYEVIYEKHWGEITDDEVRTVARDGGVSVCDHALSLWGDPEYVVTFGEDKAHAARLRWLDMRERVRAYMDVRL